MHVCFRWLIYSAKGLKLALKQVLFLPNLFVIAHLTWLCCQLKNTFKNNFFSFSLSLSLTEVDFKFRILISFESLISVRVNWFANFENEINQNRLWFVRKKVMKRNQNYRFFSTSERLVVPSLSQRQPERGLCLGHDLARRPQQQQVL